MVKDEMHRQKSGFLAQNNVLVPFMVLVLVGLFAGGMAAGLVGEWRKEAVDSSADVYLELADFPPADTPYHVYRSDYEFWVSNTGTELVVLDPHTPTWDGCTYTWEAVNGRFVDPCSGSKFAADGTLLEGPAERGLDRFDFVVIGEELIRVEVALEGE